MSETQESRWTGPEFRERRVERRLTQTQVAERIGVHRATVRAAEQGKPIEERTWVGLRKVLSTPVEDAIDVEATPARVELLGLGAMVAVMERMLPGERRRALAYLADRYGEAKP